MDMHAISNIAKMATGTSSRQKMELAKYLLCLACDEMDAVIDMDKNRSNQASKIKADVFHSATEIVNLIDML